MSALNPAYRPDIDGLRACAVIPVVLYHAGFASFSGGYVGVDVFFVISGFLITSIILPEITGGNFRLANFYERRVRRLFPALFALLFICCIPAYLLLMPQELEDFGQSVATTTLFSSNLLFWSESGYFEGPAELKPLLHTWSLAIEEQYYLLFPGVLLLIHRFGGSAFAAWTLGLLAASFALSVWSVANHPDAGFFLLPSRTWELMLGSWLAIARPPLPHASWLNNNWLRELLAAAGLVCLGIAVFGYEPSTPFPGVAALLPCIGTALIIYTGLSSHAPGAPTAQPQTLTARALGWRPLVWFGLISYSLYLWHWPILVFARHYLVRSLTLWEAGALVALSVVAAYLSWRFIERPFRRRRHEAKTTLTTTATTTNGLGSTVQTPKRLFQLTAVTMTALIAVGVVFDESEGLPNRLSTTTMKIAEVALDRPPERKQCEGIPSATISIDTLCRVNASAQQPSFMVWGDSHAAMLMPALRDASLAKHLNGINATTNGCAPLLGVVRQVPSLIEECLAYNKAILKLLQEQPQIHTVFLISRWGVHAEGGPYGDEGGAVAWLQTTSELARTRAASQRLFQQSLIYTLNELRQMGRRVVVMGPTPAMGRDIPNDLAKAAHRNRQVNLNLPLPDFKTRQAFVLPTLQTWSKQAGAEFVPLHPIFCDNDFCYPLDDGLPLYSDDDHLASTGAAKTVPLFQELLAQELDDASG